MITKSVTPHIEYILDTLDKIHANTPTDREKFLTDLNAQDATIMRLQDIGEQLGRIRDQFPDFFEQYQDDSWNKFIGLRNIISHGYREIDFDIIWDIIDDKLSVFEAHLREIPKQ